jgi:hypothetical protein
VGPVAGRRQPYVQTKGAGTVWCQPPPVETGFQFRPWPSASPSPRPP